MSTTDPDLLVTNNRDEHRYEVKSGEQLAVLTYKLPDVERVRLLEG